jgi:hypothetical protein
MGRVFDGGYADYTCVRAAQVFPFRSDLDWATVGAVPLMLETSYGSLTTGLDARPGQSILIRGGTSSVGLATAVLARHREMTVLSTTRNPGKAGAVTKAGADHVLIDDGDIARQVREILPPAAPTPRSSWSERRLCPTRCGRSGSTGWCAFRDAVEPVDRARLLPDGLPAHRGAADRLQGTHPTCRHRSCRTSWTPPAPSPSRPAACTGSTRSCRRTPTWSKTRASGKLVVTT